jgi:hypothetical protein
MHRNKARRAGSDSDTGMNRLRSLDEPLQQLGVADARSERRRNAAQQAANGGSQRVTLHGDSHVFEPQTLI